jgi:hypothetical protein
MVLGYQAGASGGQIPPPVIQQQVPELIAVLSTPTRLQGQYGLRQKNS